MPFETETVQSIIEHYEGEKAVLLVKCFDISAKVLDAQPEMSATAREALSGAEYERLRAAEGERLAAIEREKLKARYAELDIEERAAIEVRAEQVEKELSPREASAEDLLAASQASPEALISMMDLALDAGIEDAALLAFAAGRQRGLEEVVNHAISVNEDWADLYTELIDADAVPELDPGDRFETFAPKAPSKQDLLMARHSDINAYGQLR